MGEIIIFEKDKADTLLSLGFRYIERDIDNRHVYVFIQTPELIKKVSSKFDNINFYINKTINF